MSPGDLRERVTFLNDDTCGRTIPRSYGGQENMGACHDVVGVNNGRIGNEQIVPEKAVAKILLRELPEGVAGMHG